ncbi:hypothetical protein BDQ17DRAFT_1435057 [Cyathus striatus]|nr:hypothetical protein BDQ17DRAFT_1435057 [Cyathus striatus]
MANPNTIQHISGITIYDLLACLYEELQEPIQQHEHYSDALGGREREALSRAATWNVGEGKGHEHEGVFVVIWSVDGGVLCVLEGHIIQIRIRLSLKEVEDKCIDNVRYNSRLEGALQGDEGVFHECVGSQAEDDSAGGSTTSSPALSSPSILTSVPIHTHTHTTNTTNTNTPTVPLTTHSLQPHMPVSTQTATLKPMVYPPQQSSVQSQQQPTQQRSARAASKALLSYNQQQQQLQPHLSPTNRSPTSVATPGPTAGTGATASASTAKGKKNANEIWSTCHKNLVCHTTHYSAL